MNWTLDLLFNIATVLAITSATFGFGWLFGIYLHRRYMRRGAPSPFKVRRICSFFAIFFSFLSVRFLAVHGLILAVAFVLFIWGVLTGFEKHRIRLREFFSRSFWFRGNKTAGTLVEE